MPYNSESATAGSQPAQQAQGNTPSQGIFGSIANLLGSANPNTQAQGAIAGAQAPGIAQSGLSMEQLLSEIGLAGPQTAETGQYNTQQLALSEAGLGLTAG